jgi:hypothetical protein
MIDLQFADNWMRLSDAERVLLVTETVKKSTLKENWLKSLSVVSANIDGQIIFRYCNSMPANIRGAFLLDIEKYIKDEIDVALTVWLEPIGDRNSLRKLRGIEVKS